jgi:S1-C subfamily serine protease
VRTAQEALTRIARRAPGKTVQLRVQRGQQVAEIPIEVTERPRAQR